MDSIEFNNKDFWSKQGKKHAEKLDTDTLKRELEEMGEQIKQGKILGVDMEDVEIVALEMASELNKRLKKG